MKKLLTSTLIVMLLLVMCMPMTFAVKANFVRNTVVEVNFSYNNGSVNWASAPFGTSAKFKIHVYGASGKQIFTDDCSGASYNLRTKLRLLNYPNEKISLYAEAVGLNKETQSYSIDYVGGNSSIQVKLSDDGKMTWNKISEASKYYIWGFCGGASFLKTSETESYDLQSYLDEKKLAVGTWELLVEARDEKGDDIGIYGTSNYEFLLPLDNPENLSWYNSIAKWGKVTWATEYVVKLYSDKDEVVAIEKTSETSFDFSKETLKEGYYFSVVATAEEHRDTKEIFSLKYAVDYPTLATPTNLKWDAEYVARWDAVENATEYSITLCNVAGGIMKKDKTTKNEYDFSTTVVSKGSYFIVKATAEGYKDSNTASSPKYEEGVTEQPKEEVKYTIKFNTDGGSEVKSQEVIEGEKATKPKDPTKEGYTFDGWYTTKKFAVAFDFDKEVKADYTLYAKWIEDKKEEQPKEEKPEEKPWGKASEWALKELDKAFEAELIPTIFDSEDLTKNITRKEFAHVAVKLYEKLTGNKAMAIAKNPFKDTNDQEVLKAFNVGITQGTGADTFEPDTLITREQMATMMTRALTKAGIDTTVDLEKATKFADGDQIGEWYVESVYFMSNVEIIKGVGDNKFDPKGGASREASLLISVRSAEKFAKK